MKNNITIKILLCLLTVFATLMSLAFSDTNSDSMFKVTYATTWPSQSSSSSSSATPSLSESLQQAQQGLQSSINNQINQTFTDTIKDINKNYHVTNSSIPAISDTTLKNSELNPSSNNTETTQKVKVGDIDMAYKIFGKGSPLLLIPGFSMPMDGWDPAMLNNLSLNHTIIIFDNRGIGNTTIGSKTPSIQQFANDTSGMLDALEIKKPVDVLGYSMGGYIAQELALNQPQKVNKLILIGTDCGVYSTTHTMPPQITPEVGETMNSGNFTADTFVSIMFPKEWIKENSAYFQKFFSGVTMVSKEGIHIQNQAASNWTGTCDRLSGINKPTLVMVGTEDIVRPPENSIMLAQKIPGTWLVQIKDGGHGVMYQYPENVSKIIETFLSTTP